MRITRRGLQLALAGLWMLDGALQYQPFMFTRGFLGQIIEPTAQGQPGPIATSILGPAHFVSHHEVAFNAVFATIQVLLAAGIFFRRTTRVGLAASIAWSLGVWWFGEGAGALATGHATLLTGAPGAVLLYAVIALLAWPEREGSSAGAAPGGVMGENGPRIVWALVWVGGAALRVLPANLSSDSFHDAFAAGIDGQPQPIAGLNSHLAHASAGHGVAIGIGLAVVEVVVGLGVLLGWRPKMLLGIGVVLAVGFWITAEGLGAIPTGQGTDPNTGPLLVLLALAVAGCIDQEPARSRTADNLSAAEPALVSSGVPSTGTPTPRANPGTVAGRR